MINLLVSTLLCTQLAASGDQTVLATAERFFYREDFQQASELIDLHVWMDNSLWKQAGLIRELCSSGLSIECSALPETDINPVSNSISVRLSGEFQSGDSVRIILPVPAELPWQQLDTTPYISFSGFSIGTEEESNGWLTITGRSTGLFEIELTRSVVVNPPLFPGSDAAGIDDATLPFPGEDPFLDSCLSTDLFWVGGDIVYLESVALATAEPNPMRLVERVISSIAPYFSSSSDFTNQILVRPVSEMTLEGEMSNSLGAASLGAALLRRLQIPAIVVPGYWGVDGSPGFLLATYVKPFGWMVISPYPAGFTATGSFDPPECNSWFNGIPGITFHAEYLGNDGFWHAVRVDSPEFTYSVEILTQ